MERDEIQLAETFADLARVLLAEREVGTVLTKIVESAVDTIEACEHAGIELVERGTIRPVAPSSRVAERIALIQNDLGEGPCLSAIREHETFSTDDLLHDDRWPSFGPIAHAETGVTSIIGFRLFADTDTMGALNLYSLAPQAFDEEAAAIGTVLAAHAAVALSSEREVARLHDAIETRDIIGQAKGIIMARGHVDADRAFEMLRAASQRLNVKLKAVAEQVVTSDASHEDTGL